MTLPTNPGNPYRAHILVGPTAAGKSAVAQWIAEQKGWVILSADSMLVYRGMTIGTAKPSKRDRSRVCYWGIDLVDPSETFSVAMYLEEARRCLASLEPGQQLIVVGGTGLYVRALLDGIDSRPAAAPDVRAQWQGVFERDGVEGLQRALQVRNPGWYASLADKRNPRRLLRALEGIEAGMSEPPQSWRRDREVPVVAGLTMERDALLQRIEARVQAMYRDGLLEETRGLMGGDRAWSTTAAQAIGYEEAAACLRGALSREEAMNLTVIRTRQLAKRQLTWFRGKLSVRWVDSARTDSVAEVASRVLEVWDTTGATPLGI